jgi:hypothetical protein
MNVLIKSVMYKESEIHKLRSQTYKLITVVFGSLPLHLQKGSCNVEFSLYGSTIAKHQPILEKRGCLRVLKSWK